MHEKYLQTQKFPQATLKINEFGFLEGRSGDCKFSGSLTLKNVSKQINGTCNINSIEQKEIEGNAEFEIKIDDFPIEIPSYLGITVADKVTVSVKFNAIKS